MYQQKPLLKKTAVGKPLKSSNQNAPLSSLTKILKKYKSQDMYSASPRKFGSKKNEKNDKSDKSVNTSTNKSSSKTGSKSKLNSLRQPPNSSQKPIQKHLEISLNSPANSSTEAKNQNIPNSRSQFPLEKIMNDASFQDFDTEENIGETVDEFDEIKKDDHIIEDDDENCDVDEGIKASEVNSDFYISQINENTQLTSGNIVKHIPNMLVNPFISQDAFTSKPSIVDESSTQISQSTLPQQDDIDNYYRKMLIAAKKGDKDSFLDCLQNIIPRGNINFCDESGWTALHYACDEGCLKIVEILIKANCDINAKTNNKKTGLHLASSRGYFDISKILIENGCSINQFDNEKNSPIHLCAIGGHIELLKYLLEKLPQADTKNIYGKTPTELATKPEIKEILKTFLSKKESQYHHVVIQNANDVHMNKMLNNGGDININIQTNINNASMSMSTNNLNQSSNRVISKKIKIGEKVNVTVKANIGGERSEQNLGSSQLQKSATLKDRIIPRAFQKGYNFNPPTQIKKCMGNGTDSNSTKLLNIKLPKMKGLTAFTMTKKSPVNQDKIRREINMEECDIYGSDMEKSSNPLGTSTHLYSPGGLNKTSNNTSQLHNTSSRTHTTHKMISHTEDNTMGLNSIEEEKITPTSFVCLGLLGKGSFGDVYLVKKINNGVQYAMKVLSKNRIQSQNLLKYAMAERNVLSLTNHPFIVKLNFAFQTQNKLFLILDYCSNGDLSKQLYYEKRFTEERAKFYICEICLALEDLHRRDIIFRDLKPDNVVLDSEGHAKLTDFGLSKEGVYESNCAKSFCGSIAYLAPEMLKRAGHGKAVDWYLLGVLFYEMLVGLPPFFTDVKEEIFRNIEHGELQIPKFVSKGANSLLRGLLQRDPLKRLGGGVSDALEVKSHPYFNDVNWDDVYNKRVTPPKVRNYSKMMQVYNKPRLFQKEDEMRKSENYLNGWSFVINDENY